MSETVSCPSCHRSLDLPTDQLGQEARCPACGTRFVARAAGPIDPAAIQKEVPAPPPVWGDAVADRSGGDRAGDAAGWASVRTGITIALVCVCTQVGLGVLMGCFGAELNRPGLRERGPGPGTRAALDRIFTAVMVCLQGVHVFGYRCCMAAPRHHGAKGQAVATFVLGAAHLLLNAFLALGVLGGAPRPDGGPAVVGAGEQAAAGALSLVAALLGVAMIFCFLFFLRAVALCWDAGWLARSVQGLMILLGSLIALAVLLAFAIAGTGLLMWGGEMGPADKNVGAGAVGLVLGVGCFVLLGALAALVWYVVTLAQGRQVIRPYP